MGELLEHREPEPTGIFEVEFAGARYDDVVVVTSKLFFHMTKAFPKRTLYAITFDGTAFRFNRHAQTKMSERVRNAEDRTLAQAQDFAALEEPTVLPGKMKAIFRSEGKITSRQR